MTFSWFVTEKARVVAPSRKTERIGGKTKAATGWPPPHGLDESARKVN